MCVCLRELNAILDVLTVLEHPEYMSKGAKCCFGSFDCFGAS